MANSQLLVSVFIAELIGTFLLVLIGDGAIAGYLFSGRKPDLLAVCMAFGVGATMGMFVSGRISGAHLNPAASLAHALGGKLKWRRLPLYMLAQYLGAALAAIALYANYYEAIHALEGSLQAPTSANSTAFVFATYPAHYVSIWGALLDQTLGTCVLVFCICALTDGSNLGLPASQQPFGVGLAIMFSCVAFAANCGAIFNPARDLAPRVVTALLGYPETFAPLSSLYWLVAGVLGPHLGAALGFFGYSQLIARNLPPKPASDAHSLDAEPRLVSAKPVLGGCNTLVALTRS